MASLLLAIIYLAFISLGLPDGLIGSAWPSIYPDLNVPLSYAGIISMVISLGTIFSSLASNFLTSKFGTEKVTLVSVAMTALSLLGFYFSNDFWLLILLSVPYGLGAGSIDAALNNYVANHYSSRHMSWLHCMWGLGATIGPYIMSYALIKDNSWRHGFGYVSIIQIILTIILLFSFPLWNKVNKNNAEIIQNKNYEEKTTLLNALKLKGVKEVLITFFCYCALEATIMLWSSSYMVINNEISEELAASYASVFYLTMTIGRLISGFISIKFSDIKLVRIGFCIMLIGILTLFLDLGIIATIIGISIIGLGCAPIYPCIIHSTPVRFGKINSQAIIGLEMASAYIGTCLIPPLFGILARNINMTIFPWFILIFFALMIITHEILIKNTSNK